MPVLSQFYFSNVEECVDALNGIYCLELLTFLVAKMAKGKLIYKFTVCDTRADGGV